MYEAYVWTLQVESDNGLVPAVILDHEQQSHADPTSFTVTGRMVPVLVDGGYEYRELVQPERVIDQHGVVTFDGPVGTAPLRGSSLTLNRIVVSDVSVIDSIVERVGEARSILMWAQDMDDETVYDDPLTAPLYHPESYWTVEEVAELSAWMVAIGLDPQMFFQWINPAFGNPEDYGEFDAMNWMLSHTRKRFTDLTAELWRQITL